MFFRVRDRDDEVLGLDAELGGEAAEANQRLDRDVLSVPGLRAVLLLEGILLFAVPKLLSLMDLKVFVDTPADLRILRRLLRDTRERGRTPGA